jgi:signal transduction histidine kinase
MVQKAALLNIVVNGIEMSVTSEDLTGQHGALWRIVGRWLTRVMQRPQDDEHTGARLEKQIRDFISGSLALYWKRQGIYLSAALLCGYYYSIQVSVFCYLMCEVTESLEMILSRRIMRWKGGDLKQARRYRNLLFVTSTLSSIAVSLFVYLVAYMEGVSSHFTPLFFLFAAGLFAAVNNHQLPQILAVRLLIYGAVFLYIPLSDIWAVGASLNSPEWLQFLTVLFVLYFVLECSVIFLQLYRRGLDQLDELRLERDKAQEAYEVKSQFVSVVSHELRTPLTSISGALSLLRSGAFLTDPDRAKNILEIAYKNSQRLSSLINDLLDLQKLESGQMSYNFHEMDMGDLLEEAVASIDSYAHSFGVKVQYDRQDLSAVIAADHDRLLQVLDNLLSNAVKFSKRDGTVEIDLQTTRDTVQVSVRDHGIGIPENAREKVFGRFSQIDSSDRRAHGGTGLGLSIALEIVNAHGGSIDYVSRLGEGTTFTIEFPLKRL